MLAILVRAIVLYIAVIAAMRFTGKRQLAQLQPSDFVVAFLMSEVAALPMEDSEIPLLAGLVPILVLVSLDVIVSAVNLKNQKFRKLITGNPVVVIDDGKLDQKAMKSLRLTIQDLLDSLRLKGIFDISEVQYAIVETNGDISLLEKAPFRPAQANQVTKKLENTPIPYSVITDGVLLENNLNKAGTNKGEVLYQLHKQGLNQREVLLMTADLDGNYNIIIKDKNI